jgi:hypothetical protein
MSSESSITSSWEKKDYKKQNDENKVYYEYSKTPIYSNMFSQKRFIGKGGFGHVYLSENKSDKQEYAVKKINLTGNNNMN